MGRLVGTRRNPHGSGTREGNGKGTHALGNFAGHLDLLSVGGSWYKL